MKTLPGAVRLAAIWLSPAALLGLGPLLLADGTRGLWAFLVLAGGAPLAVLLLSGSWGRDVASSGSTLPDLARRRWPSAGRILAPLAVGGAGSALLFVWAQVAAAREVAEALGWSRLAAVGMAGAVLAFAGSRSGLGARLVTLSSVVALVGLIVPLAAVMAATTPWWPRVWREVASRPRVVFAAHGAWTTAGRPVHGVGTDAALAFTDEQRVALLGRGRVRIAPWEGGESQRDVAGAMELTLRPGDRLAVPLGFPLRFQAGRRIPGAPETGPDWITPPGRRFGWRTLVGLGATLLLGVLGLPALHVTLPAETSGEHRAARVGAILAVVGVVAAMLWALYAAWLTPEVYIAGVAGIEVYELPDRVEGLGAWGGPLFLLALAGLAAGGVTAALAALRGGSQAPGAGLDGSRIPVVGAIVAASLLAIVTPARSWALLLAAFGLGASVSAPAAVLVCWGERVSARGLAVGASVGLALFGGLALAGLGGAGLAGRGGDGSWLGWVLAWPALVALPANALSAWLASSGPVVSPRSPLPPGLTDLHD